MRTLSNISIEPNVAPSIDLLPLIGETAWHSVTLDPSIAEVSKAHFDQLVADLRNYGVLRPGLKVLEVAAYAHVTGYMFAESYNAEVTLFDVSASTLRLGLDLATERSLHSTRVRRVAGDFHSLPFDTCEFDVVYISSALHHTWRWRSVLAELVRVTKVGGHLILENEPCRRELCFYRFRTNRQEELNAAETFLDQQGLLRTVAEPYLGSRSEQLFGMTENQEIRLPELSLSSNLVFLRASPQICMGYFENAIDRALGSLSDSPVQTLDNIRSIISGAFEEARIEVRRLGALEASLLPDVIHVDALIMRICGLLENSSYGRGELMLASSGSLTPVSTEHLSKLLKPLIEVDSKLARDLDRATLFGAAIKVIACKQSELEVGRTKRLEAITVDGVDIMFEPEVFQLMDPRNTLFPEMQCAAIEDIVQAFGVDWNIAVNDNGVRVATPIVDSPKVQTDPAQAEHVVVFARVYGVGGEQPWTLWLTVDGERRANLVFDKSGSGLLLASVSNAVGPIRIEFEALGTEKCGTPKFNLAHLGVLKIPV